MRTINIDDKRYCSRCPFESLQVAQKVIYQDNKKEVINTVRCENANLCERLWSYLVDRYEDDEEDAEPEEQYINDDWSFVKDATREDMSL